MKVVILAGGRGTRISEETEVLPKPMVEIGGKPIIWHIMRIYSHYGFNDFVICLGYKGYLVKEYFSHYFLHTSDVTIDMKTNEMKIHSSAAEPWKVTLLDTGSDTMTGGRILRIKEYINKGTFMLTYGDGVGNINIPALVNLHKKSGKLATVTAVASTGRFGVFDINQKGSVAGFLEKPKVEGAWINGGFFVLDPGIFKYIKQGDNTIWEKQPMEELVQSGQLNAYRHEGFWKCMDTLRDKIELEQLWHSEVPPWKVW